MFTNINNIVIGVKNVEEAAKVYSDTLGLNMITPPADRPEIGLKNAMFSVGDAHIELVEPLVPEQGPVANFLKNRGEGLYMIELEVEDIDEAVKVLKEKGARIVEPDAHRRSTGSGVFIHPQSAKGVLIQVVHRR